MSPRTGQSPAYCVLSKPFSPVLVFFTDEEFEALREIKASPKNLAFGSVGKRHSQRFEGYMVDPFLSFLL